MRGRVVPGEPLFGSDSFLDVIANLVGILVIMIVLAGLQVSRVPVSTSELASALASRPASAPPANPAAPVNEAPEDTSPPQDNRAEGTLLAAPEPAPSELAAPEAAPPALIPTGPTAAEISADIERTERAIARLRRQLETEQPDAALDSLRQLQFELSARTRGLAKLQRDLSLALGKQSVAQQELDRRDAEYGRLRQELVETNLLLEQLAQARPKTEELELRINPIGRQAKTEEISFRIDGGRVYELPVKDLCERIAGREQFNTSLLRGETTTGRVGPLDGVSLTYEFALQSVRVGGGVASTPVLRGILHCDLSQSGQPVEDALREGGLLQRSLLNAPTGAVVRLFIATDNFGPGLKVSKAARDLGFAVDSRPIEPGRDIPFVAGLGSDAIVQ